MKRFASSALASLLLSLGSVATSHAIEILRWERLPLAVPLVVGQERVIFIDRNVRIGLPDSLGAHLRMQSAGGAIYLRASEAIPPTRLQLQDVESGALILLDIAAEPAKAGQAPLEPIRIVEGDGTPSRPENPATSRADEDESGNTAESIGTSARRATPVPVILTRHAAQNLYAPLRTVEPVPGIGRVNLRRNVSLDTLLPTLPLRAQTLAAWRLEDQWVTAVKLTNTSARALELDPRALQGNFVAATFQHPNLGPAGRTSDTVATLVAQVKQLRNELQTALNDNKNQKTENERMRARESAIDQRIQSALDGERGRLQQDRDQLINERQQTQGLLQDLQRRLDGLSGKDTQAGQADLPIGLGLEDGDGRHFGAQASGPRPGAAGTRWVEPNDAKLAKSGASTGTLAFPTSFAPSQKTLSGAVDSVTETATDIGQRAAGSGARPVYTVPANSTLMGSIAMTALIGRVPIDGTVNDPYPFKVLIGPDNLTANGIDIPDVAGAVVSGTASGDWTLSCVRGQIRSVTFVFQDGTIRTVPEDGGRAQSSNQGGGTGSGNGTTQGGLGWISDPYGIPCVSGERRSNAQQYLGSQALITAAGAGAASLIQSDNGSVAVVANSNGSLGTVGISGNEAMGRILAGGVRDMADWVNKLYGQAFAAIYVPPSARVAVHLEHPLNIDHDAKGRRVNHRPGGNHASDLD